MDESIWEPSICAKWPVALAAAWPGQKSKPSRQVANEEEPVNLNWKA